MHRTDQPPAPRPAQAPDSPPTPTPVRQTAFTNCEWRKRWGHGCQRDPGAVQSLRGQPKTENVGQPKVKIQEQKSSFPNLSEKTHFTATRQFGIGLKINSKRNQYKNSILVSGLAGPRIWVLVHCGKYSVNLQEKIWRQILRKFTTHVLELHRQKITRISLHRQFQITFTLQPLTMDKHIKRHE